jgi:hypothetical protein
MKTIRSLAVSAAFLLPFASAAGAAEPRYGTPEQPLDGTRYQTMLALGSHLDSTAQRALDGAVDEARRGSVSEGRFVSSTRAFARSSGDFRRKLEGYQEAPFDVPVRVAALTESARGLSVRLRAAGALKSTYDDWSAVIDVLGRMTRLLAGGAVDVPTAFVAPALSGATLEQFVGLARALDRSAAGAHDRARQEIGDYPSRGAQFLGELEYLAARSKDLRTQAESGDRRPREIGGAVDRLLSEARQADRAMRQAEVFSGAWSESGRTITLLERMASLVRS